MSLPKPCLAVSSSCSLGLPTTQTYECALLTPPIFFCQDLAAIAMFESEYDSITGPPTKLEPYSVYHLMYDPYISTCSSLSFYPSPGQRAKTWSVLLVVFFFILSALKVSSMSSLILLHLLSVRMCGACDCVWPFGFISVLENDLVMADHVQCCKGNCFLRGRVSFTVWITRGPVSVKFLWQSANTNMEDVTALSFWSSISCLALQVISGFVNKSRNTSF